MRFFGTAHPLLRSQPDPLRRVPDEALPGITAGAFAAWARAEGRREAVRDAAGADCLTLDGRRGRVVEMLDGGFPVLVCQAI